jgi:2,3-dihydroxy-p-cumate/2,3-dihydroxybenzoate 3,4-dioxygenase
MTGLASQIRYRRLGYVALNVTDIARSAAFYDEVVGLKRAETGPWGEVYFRCGSTHHDLVLYPAAEPGLKRVGWQLTPGSLGIAAEHLKTLGIKTKPVPPAEAKALGIGEAYRFTEPHTGGTFEFYAEIADAGADFVPSHTKIARLGHVVFSLTDRAAAEKFFVEQLNFRVSDRITDTVTFMRCFPNRFHHSLGLSQSASPHLHHVNLMVSEVDDIGKALNRLKKAEAPIVYGPGRHPPSESMFLYFLDPDGMTVEYSFGMEEFGEHDARAPRDLPRKPESFDYWGGLPSRDFAARGAIEPLETT